MTSGGTLWRVGRADMPFPRVHTWGKTLFIRNRAVAAGLSTAALLLAAVPAAHAADASAPADASTDRLVAAPAEGRTGDQAQGRQHRAPSAGVFITDGDRVHVSSTPPPTASGHGWWKKISGPGTKAKVTVTLQARPYGASGWRDVATGSKTVKSGGGAGKRATARKTCTNLIQKTEWRSVIDVDIIGVADSPEKVSTKAATLFCGF
jgi:hypothetical protein